MHNRFGTLIAMLALGCRYASCVEPEPCRWAHGRLMRYQGGPGLRIWEIGTHHVFGLPPLVPAMDLGDLPPNAEKLLNNDNMLFGDYKVCPLEPYSAGHMQAARVVAARHLRSEPK